MNKLMKDYAKNPVVPTGFVNGALGLQLEDGSDFSSSDDDDELDVVYEQEYVQQEMKKYSAVTEKGGTASSLSGLSDVEGVDGFVPNSLDVYRTHQFNTTFNKPELPIDAFKERILGLVNTNNVVVIQGPTGCGKTTQVPQFILDDCRSRGESCNIIVTQPRKIATITVARRVCEERGWTLGTICGYQVGLEKQISPDMLLTYVTTGVLLQKIISAKSLRNFSHIIIDEVHERNQELDFLLLIVRKFLFTNSPQTKVILMSATIEAKEFAHYFRSQNRVQEFLTPIIYLDKGSPFGKQVFFSDQLNIVQPPKYDIDKPQIFEETWKSFLFLVKVFDKLDIEDPVTNQKVLGSVLVFLPGIHEIEEANNRLLPLNKQCNEVKWDIIPLHSSLPNDEQRKAFKKPIPGFRKVILSTNIAESSITLPDTAYVIDFCMTKTMTVDLVSKYSSLKLEWASHVNCEQRAGRVGRVSKGRVYRLISHNFYENVMPKKTIPEIMRAPLERVVLQAKMLNLNDTPKQILALAINPPNLKNIESTVWQLKEVGGLLMTCRGVNSPSDGDITFLGTVMAQLPIDVNLSKLIILGYIFSCFEEAVIIAAGCSIQNIFSIPFQQKYNAYKKMLVWADGSSSDLIALLNLYNVWQLSKRENNFENHQSELRWCSMNFVSYKGLKEWNILITEIKARLERLQIVDTIGQAKVCLTTVEKPTVLKIITSGAFYPNYFTRSSQFGQVDEREAVKMVGGRDPFRTVYLTGMDPTQPGQLYVRAIKKLIGDQDGHNDQDVSIGFDGSSKVYVEFKNVHDPVSVHMDGQQVLTAIPGKIPLVVYEAVRKRQLKFSFSLKVLPYAEAWEWAAKFGVKRGNQNNQVVEVQHRNCFSNVDYSPIPTLDTEYITIIVTSKVDAGHFWVQNFNEEISDLLVKIYDTLNRQVLHPVEKINGRPNPIKVGHLYAARFDEDGKFYRCKVTSFGADVAQVLFIDFGNIQSVKISELYKLPQRSECQVAPLAMECVLSGVRPSITLNPKALWSDKINKLFDEKTRNIILYGKVYSVVNDVVYLELFRKLPEGQYNEKMTSLNDWLIQEGYAQACEESYLSKEDHEKRVQVLKAENPNNEACRLGLDKVVGYDDFRAPRIGENYTKLDLKGPFSPLEMKISGCVEGASNRTVDIEVSSVNTVLLDNEPQNPHARLIVARHVAQAQSGNRLILRQTTIMPSVPGFPMLMALLFCPQMEPKLTNDGTRVASILCGLGCNDISKKPCYPLHDLVIPLDTDLQVEEIEKVNKIRYMMNNCIKTMAAIRRNIATQDDMLRNQITIKNALFDLIYTHRQSVDVINVQFNNIWKKTSADVVILRSNIADDPEDLWPLLWFVKLNNSNNYNPLIAKNIDDLDQIASKMITAREIMCELCKVPLLTIYDVRFHLISDSHNDKRTEYYQNLQSSEEED